MWLRYVLLISIVAVTPLAAEHPFEDVQGLYYFTDRGMFQPAIAGSKAVFSEDIHSGPVIDFKGRLAFTFDDVTFGPYLGNLLDLLKAHHISAVFFLTATHIGESDSKIVKLWLERMIADGHVLGNHSAGHPELDRGPFARAGALDATKSEFQRLEDLVDRILGRHYDMKYVRPPFGIRGNSGKGLGERMSLPGRVDMACAQRGQKLILWHINSLDFLMSPELTAKDRLNKEQVTNACIERIRATSGGCILFHSNARTASVVAPIVQGLEKDRLVDGTSKWSFGTVADLLKIKYGTED